MIKSCRFCRYSYCADETDVSGLSCEKNNIIKIIELEKVHELCFGNYKFSWLKFLFRL